MYSTYYTLKITYESWKYKARARKTYALYQTPNPNPNLNPNQQPKTKKKTPKQQL